MDSREFACPAVVRYPCPLSPLVEFSPCIPRESEKSSNPGFPRVGIRTPEKVLYHNSRHRDGIPAGILFSPNPWTPVNSPLRQSYGTPVPYHLPWNSLRESLRSRRNRRIPDFPNMSPALRTKAMYRHRDGEASARVDTRGAGLVREFAWEILRQFLYQFAVQAAWPAGKYSDFALVTVTFDTKDR